MRRRLVAPRPGQRIACPYVACHTSFGLVGSLLAASGGMAPWGSEGPGVSCLRSGGLASLNPACSSFGEQEPPSVGSAAISSAVGSRPKQQLTSLSTSRETPGFLCRGGPARLVARDVLARQPLLGRRSCQCRPAILALARSRSNGEPLISARTSRRLSRHFPNRIQNTTPGGTLDYTPPMEQYVSRFE